MKKILLILFTISIVLVGCDDNDPDKIDNEFNSELSKKSVNNEELMDYLMVPSLFYIEDLSGENNFVYNIEVLSTDEFLTLSQDKQIDVVLSLGKLVNEMLDDETFAEQLSCKEQEVQCSLNNISVQTNDFNYYYEYSYSDFKNNQELAVTAGKSTFDNKTVYVSNPMDSKATIVTKPMDETHYTSPYEPQIGMTADDIINSTWGKPTDINTTTTEYSTSEQWVYSNYQYLYFDDGILTSIQQ